MKQLMNWTAMVAFAVLLVSAGSAGAVMIKADVEGKVMTYEKGKSIEVEVGAEKKMFKIDDKTEVKGEVEVGKMIKLSEKEGVALKIEVKE